MFSVTTIFTLGGMALAGGAIDTILDMMGKESYATLIRVIVFSALGVFAIMSISDLFTLLQKTFL